MLRRPLNRRAKRWRITSRRSTLPTSAVCGPSLGVNVPMTWHWRSQLFDIMAAESRRYTQSVLATRIPAVDGAASDAALRDRFIGSPLDAWTDDYRACLRAEGPRDDAVRAAAMRAVNPRYVLRPPVSRHRAGGTRRLMRRSTVCWTLLSHPFDEQPGATGLCCRTARLGRHSQVSCRPETWFNPVPSLRSNRHHGHPVQSKTRSSRTPLPSQDRQC